LNQIDQIKEILFSNEKRALDALTRRLEGRESRVADIADVLPEALGRSHANDDRLNNALRIPVEECLKDSIQKDPQDFADALFPVMGPAIRKSITETLKTFTESINRAIEEKTSVKSIKWRMQARKAGIPYAQYLVQRNLAYRVDHAYLIQPNSGLLIADAHRPEATRKDDEAVTAMLTAIQDFVRESFSPNEKGDLETADIGEYSLWTMQGPSAMLACVIYGMPPRSLRDDFMDILERIHLQYSEQLDTFEGEKILKAVPLVEECLLSQNKELAEAPSKKKFGAFGLITLLGLGALAWFGWQRFQFNQQAGDYLENLQAQPGIVLTNTELNGGKLTVNGLRDQSAVLPTDLLNATDLPKEKVNLDFTPFHSMESEIIKKRLLSRLTLPAGVNMQLSEKGELSFSGRISPEFKQKAQTAIDGQLGIQSVNFGDVWFSDEAILAQVVNSVKPPESVNLEVKNKILNVTGNASIDFHKQLADLAPSIEGLDGLNSAGLEIAEFATITRLEESLNESVYRFNWRTNLEEATNAELPKAASMLKEYGNTLEKLNVFPEVVLTGYTDQSGDLQQNRDLQEERALYLKGRLVGLGVKPAWLFVKASPLAPSADGETDPEMRKVVITVKSDLSKLDILGGLAK